MGIVPQALLKKSYLKFGMDLVQSNTEFLVKEEPFRAWICKRLRSPGIDSKGSYVAWQAGMITLFYATARQAK